MHHCEWNHDQIEGTLRAHRPWYRAYSKMAKTICFCIIIITYDYLQKGSALQWYCLQNLITENTQFRQLWWEIWHIILSILVSYNIFMQSILSIPSNKGAIIISYRPCSIAKQWDMYVSPSVCLSICPTSHGWTVSHTLSKRTTFSLFLQTFIRHFKVFSTNPY